MNVAIKLEKITKSFKYERVLNEISHEFEAGKIHGIIGFNGSGKTVLFKCICGFLQPDSGNIFVEEKKIGTEIDFPESLGMIIENPGFLPHLSGFKNLKKLASLQNKIDDQVIREAMQRVGLDSNSKKPVSQYSLGMRERLGIAQAIMEDPNILILDEPFNGLDKQGAKDICELILELRRKGKTIILVDHNIMEIEYICDTICEMDKGTLRKIKGNENNKK